MISINTALRSKMGIAEIYDPQSRIYFKLPDELRIYNRKVNAWIGGSEDGETIVYLERMAGDYKAIPTVLAEGDIDLYLCSHGPTEQLTAEAKGLRVGGTYAGLSIRGFLANVQLTDSAAYLVLAATRTTGDMVDARGIVLDLIRRMKNVVDEPYQ